MEDIRITLARAAEYLAQPNKAFHRYRKSVHLSPCPGCAVLSMVGELASAAQVVEERKGLQAQALGRINQAVLDYALPRSAESMGPETFALTQRVNFIATMALLGREAE